MKYFVISDIHGHYDVMIRELKSNNYDEKNVSHHLIVLGDLFDRGTQSKEVLDFMCKLKQENKVTIILGNHDNFLLDFLKRDYSKLLFNIGLNGFKYTLDSLVGRELTIEENWDEINREIINEYIHLYNFLETMPLYFEIGEYIFTHGGIDNTNGDWKNNEKRSFTWGRESNFDRIADKTVVVGHERVSSIRHPKVEQEDLFISNPEAFEILRRDGKIFIDGNVEISNKINVLILDM